MNFKTWADAEKRVKIQKEQIHMRNQMIRKLENALGSAKLHLIRLLADTGYPSENWGLLGWQQDIDRALGSKAGKG